MRCLSCRKAPPLPWFDDEVGIIMCYRGQGRFKHYMCRYEVHVVVAKGERCTDAKNHNFREGLERCRGVVVIFVAGH